MNVYQRGTVWIYHRGQHEKGITSGSHPCIIISPDEWNANHGSVIVIPCTSKQLAGTAIDFKLDLDISEGYIFPTQLTTVPKSRLHNFYGKLSDEMMLKIDEVIQLVIGLRPGEDWGGTIRLETAHPTILKPEKAEHTPGVKTKPAKPHEELVEPAKTVVRPRVPSRTLVGAGRSKIFTVTRARRS